MKRATTLLVALAVGVLAAQSAFAANAVRISQVYGGGGNTSATYAYDYVELFNDSGAPVNIGGWSLQYGSATGTTDLGACTNCLTILPAGASIPACGYYLVQLATGTLGGPALPVAADLVVPAATANNLSGTNGKIGLKANSSTTPCSPQNAFVDLVGYGTANCFETADAAGLSNSSMAVRKGDGTQDTDNNSADFTAVIAAVPHNSQSAQNPGCLVVPVTPNSWGRMKILYR